MDNSAGDVKRIKDKSKGKVRGEKYCIKSQDHKCRTTPETEKDIKQRPNSVRHPNLLINEDLPMHLTIDNDHNQKNTAYCVEFDTLTRLDKCDDVTMPLRVG